MVKYRLTKIIVFFYGRKTRYVKKYQKTTRQRAAIDKRKQDMSRKSEPKGNGPRFIFTCMVRMDTYVLPRTYDSKMSTRHIKKK